MADNNIAIVWDFDGTLTAKDSTSVVVEHFKGNGGEKEFWDTIKTLGNLNKKPDFEHILASDAPTWMYALSRIAFKNQISLNGEFFQKLKDKVPLYNNVEKFLRDLKKLEETPEFKKANVGISHFIVSAGLQEFVDLFFPKDLVTWVWGCRYAVTCEPGDEDNPESVPVFCMDETMKTRALFEISKGIFLNPKKKVNDRVEDKKLWAPFSNFIYVGDGPTDIPALALIRDRGGLGVVVYNPNATQVKIKERLHSMRADKRCDLITSATFGSGDELFKAIEVRCHQIRQKYEASNQV